MASAEAIDYDVFISYRHGGDDQTVAETLHRCLESFRTPAALVRRGLPRRLTRVFRDQEELESSSSLSDSILAALHRSRYLIVVCSPRARQSAWISREIEVFRSMGRGRQILALLIEGEPAEAFPSPLLARDQVAEAAATPADAEPLAADIRAEGWWQRRRLLRIELLRLIAPVLGSTFDDLRQR